MTLHSAMSKLRRAQADAVIPLIGALLDAWDSVPNDLKDELPDLRERIEAVADMMSNHP